MNVSWTIFKTFIQDKQVSTQHVDLGDSYWVMATDGNFTLNCLLMKDSGADQTDFETNFKTKIGDKSGKLPIRKDFSYSSTQTNTVLWTPVSGKRYVVTDFILNIRNNTLGAITLTIFDDTNVTGNILYKANFEAGSNYDAVCNYVTAFISSAENKSLKITTSGGLMISGTIQGYEISTEP